VGQRRATVTSPLTQGDNTPLFDGGKGGGHRRSDIDAQWQDLLHLADPTSLQDRRSVKKESQDTVTSEKDHQSVVHKKRTLTTSQVPTTQSALLATDGFSEALEALPPDDRCRTLATGRTSMLRRTSKRVKEVVDKMHLPAVVRFNRCFWDDSRNYTEKKKHQFVLSQLTGM
jgi:hypothetical protein